MDRPGQARIEGLTLPCQPVAARVLVGYSGGMDSGALLHLLAHDDGIRRLGLRAIHVHHGLHADADDWAAHCSRECAALGVPLQVVRVVVDRDSGLGTEGAARRARYAAFNESLSDGEVLALAHHRDDQAETFLLRALRSSGVDGLAAMRPWRASGSGWLWRPLLDLPRCDLRAYAIRHDLRWIEDPANAAMDIDRGFLREAVLPLLRERWPHAADSLARSAALSAQAADLLDAEDAIALQAALRADGSLGIEPLRMMPPARRARVLRRWVGTRGLPPLPGRGVRHIDHLLVARSDTDARFAWSGACVQRWRDALYARPLLPPLPIDWSEAWDGSAPLDLPGGDRLALIGAPRFEGPLRVHARGGGERIHLPGRTHRHALNHVLQERAMPPWRRARLPLLSNDEGELQAAGDAIIAAPLEAWLRAHGARLHWTGLA